MSASSFASSATSALVLGLVAAATAAAQSTDRASDFLRRSSLNIAVIQSRPHGDFARNVPIGYGFDGAYLYRVDDLGIFSIRASIGGLSYGRESRRAAFSETVGGRVQVQVSTTNYIVPMSVGPQLSWPSGLVRPYVNAGVGGQLFLSESRVEGERYGDAIASTTNHSASTSSWSLGGGVNVPLNAGRTRVLLDIAAQYIAGGTARYLTKGSIVDLPGSQIAVTSRESRTPMTVVRIGARVQR